MRLKNIYFILTILFLGTLSYACVSLGDNPDEVSKNQTAQHSEAKASCSVEETLKARKKELEETLKAKEKELKELEKLEKDLTSGELVYLKILVELGENLSFFGDEEYIKAYLSKLEIDSGEKAFTIDQFNDILGIDFQLGPINFSDAKTFQSNYGKFLDYLKTLSLIDKTSHSEKTVSKLEKWIYHIKNNITELETIKNSATKNLNEKLIKEEITQAFIRLGIEFAKEEGFKIIFVTANKDGKMGLLETEQTGEGAVIKDYALPYCKEKGYLEDSSISFISFDTKKEDDSIKILDGSKDIKDLSYAEALKLKEEEGTGV